MSKAKEKLKDVLTIDDLAKMFELPSYESIEEYNLDYISETWSAAYKEAKEQGASEQEAERAAEEAQEEATIDLYRAWHRAVLSAVEPLFRDHGLALTPRGGRERLSYEFKVTPLTSWKDAADRIRETINGVGYFYFKDLDEFLDSGPYTARQAVLAHLGWIASAPEVYGEPSARSRYEQAWR